MDKQTETPSECRRCGADIVLVNGEWLDANGGPDDIPAECTMAPRPNFGPHIPTN